MSFATSPCRSCGAPVIWAETAAEKRMPVDAAPSSNGNVVLEERPKAAPRAIVVSGSVAAGERALGHTHTSHFATCPDAAAHRKPKAG